MQLEIIRADDTVTHLTLTGRLDLAGVQNIEIAFLGHTAARGKPVLADLSGVEYMSSLGLRMLLGAFHALKRKGQTLRLFRPQTPVRETLHLAGLDELLAKSDDVNTALPSLG
jgi:anti-anti-sigma factor